MKKIKNNNEKISTALILSVLFVPIFFTLLTSFTLFKSENDEVRENHHEQVINNVLESSQGPFLQDEENTINLFQKVVPSVVGVTNITVAKSWRYGKVEIPKGAGSGLVWDDQGHIVTNYHVIEGGNHFLVTFYKDNKQYEAEVVGKARMKDVAVLKLKNSSKKVIPLSIGRSHNLLVGQKAVAIGNPFGLDHSMSTGIISALGREIKGIGGITIRDIIQTDAAINSGNSGGPLLNSKGEVIGINTAIYSTSGSNSGVSFAVPIDTVSRIVEQLIKYGKIIRPGLGISILSTQTRQQLGIYKGIPLGVVPDDSHAYKAGLRGPRTDFLGHYYLGDILIAINGKEVNSLDDIYQILDTKKVDDSVMITYIRNNQKYTVKVKLTALEE